MFLFLGGWKHSVVPRGEVLDLQPINQLCKDKKMYKIIELVPLFKASCTGLALTIDFQTAFLMRLQDSLTVFLSHFLPISSRSFEPRLFSGK